MIPIASPILVTGAHRSGSTWVGKTLAEAPGTGYLHEPFNIEGLPGIRIPTIRHWFHYVDLDGDPHIAAHLRELLRFRYPLREALRQADSFRDLGRVFREAARFGCHRFRRSRPILKDPLAVFSAPWLVEEFKANVVALVRHPAAFAGSLKARDWAHPFSHFTSQPKLLNGPLERFASRLQNAADNPPGIIQQSILLWNCIYSFLARSARSYESIRLVRHEELARTPRDSFHKLFTDLGLEYSTNVDTYIANQTNESNPVTTENPVCTARDSRRLIWSWWRRLSVEEIRQVRQGTEDTWPTFYDDSNWEPPEEFLSELVEGEH